MLAHYPELARGAEIGPVWLNGAPALRVDPGGERDTAVSLIIEAGRITHIYLIRNPQKLANLNKATPLTRTS